MKKIPMLLTRAGEGEATGTPVLVDAMEVSFCQLKYDKSCTYLCMKNGHVLDVSESVEDVHRLLAQLWRVGNGGS